MSSVQSFLTIQKQQHNYWQDKKFIMTGQCQPFEGCAIDKSNLTNVWMQTVEWSQINDERLILHIDIVILSSTSYYCEGSRA